MSKFRMVDTSFWNDPTVEEELSPEDRYFFLYLLTNSRTTQIGIYQITKRQMAFELGYSMEIVEALLERFIGHHEMVRYNIETRELAIKSWGRYNLKRAGKPVIDCVTAELQKVKDIALITYVSERVKNEMIKELFEAAADGIYGIQEDGVDVDGNQVNHDAQDLFDHYVSKNIILHKKMTPTMRRAINGRLRDYTYEELKQAIDHYADVYFSDDHWFTHKYPLADLMRDKDIRKFLDEADPLENFKIKSQRMTSNELREEDFDLS